MFKLFTTTEKPASSHSRSKTLQHTQASSGIVNASSDLTTIVNGHTFDLIEPTSVKPIALTQHEMFTGAPLTEPTKTHQRTLTEQIGSARDLPPLTTQASESEFHSTSSFTIPTLDSHTPLKEPQSSPERSRQSSPTRVKRLSIFSNAKDTHGRTEEKVGKLADWFKGESEPISIGIVPSPTKEKADPLHTMRPSSDIRPTSLLQRSPTAQPVSKPTIASRFSFLASKVSSPKPTAQGVFANDELMNLDISTALSPTSSADPYSPAAFNQLQKQSESLLLRLHAAYKERTISLHDMSAEKETLAEETQGAETKARHLKTQLDDMSAKLAEQDEAMMNLVDELAQEKLARREEEEARRRSFRAVEHTTPPTTARSRTSLENTISESGFESEDDSLAESVFSIKNGTYSPTMSISSISTPGSPEVYHAPELTPMPRAARLNLRTSLPVKGTPAVQQNGIVEAPTQSTCANCHGVRASEAWSVVGILKAENAGLKERVGELEGALDGCLDVVCRLSC